MEIVTESKEDYPGMKQRLKHIEDQATKKRMERRDPTHDSKSPWGTIDFYLGIGTMGVILLWLITLGTFLSWITAGTLPPWTDWILLMLTLGITAGWAWFLSYSKVI